MDRIIISDLKARCIIGIDADERREKQDVVINVSLASDIEDACRSDRFEDALDYRALKKQILAMVEGSQFHLIEALAEAVAHICLDHPRARETTVRVDKPSALRFARSVAVEVTRSRGEKR